MKPQKNPRGYIRFPSEKELYQFLEKRFLLNFFYVIPQYEFAPKQIIDYIATDNDGKISLIEVKNWFVTINDMKQILGYLAHASEKYGNEGYKFILIAGGIEEERREFLEKLKIEILLTKDL